MPESPRVVLCVDDDADDREMVSNTIFEIDPSFKVVHAENGIEAIEYLSKAKVADDLPCLVILDINM
ncbi:MAG: response regulator, partial [Bacteroidota bacterium]|nr:response regulator [Bacteroidota bacterium]